jgi:hypothetical protein
MKYLNYFLLCAKRKYFRISKYSSARIRIIGNFCRQLSILTERKLIKHDFKVKN